jgi:hypothetical protein
VYIDARKFDYEKFSYPDAARLIDRDKEVARITYRNWMEANVAEIVERQWAVVDIGAAERVGDFIKLLKEAEFTYALGAYTSAIALVGVCAEDLCRFFATSAGHNMDGDSQFSRVEQLRNIGAITSATAAQFDVIRQLRNDCLHFNAGFKQKDEPTLKADALAALNAIKGVYAEIVGVVDYKTIDTTKFHTMVDAILHEAVGTGLSGLGVNSAVSRTRNLFAAVLGFDMSMNSASPVYKTSMFKILDIDAASDPPEIALRDMVVDLPLIVDVTPAELASISAAGIAKEDIVAATLMSIPNELEPTGIWRLWTPLRKLA